MLTVSMMHYPFTCERCRLGHGTILVLCGDDAGSGTESRWGQQGQLLHDAAAARVVLRQLIEALLQRISQEVEFLTGLIETSLGLETGREGGEESKKRRKGRGVEMDGNISNMALFPHFCFGGTLLHWGIRLYDENLDPTTKHLPLNEPFFLWLFPTPGVSSRFWLPRPQQTLSWRGDTALPPAGPAG